MNLQKYMSKMNITATISTDMVLLTSIIRIIIDGFHMIHL